MAGHEMFHVSGLFNWIKNSSEYGGSCVIGLHCYKFKMKEMKTNIYVAL